MNSNFRIRWLGSLNLFSFMPDASKYKEQALQ
jgi:hypothetical protein